MVLNIVDLAPRARARYLEVGQRYGSACWRRPTRLSTSPESATAGAMTRLVE